MDNVRSSWHLGQIANMFAVNLRPELRELYGFSLLYSFAFALITIFEPVFFYKEGFSLWFIALYYAIHYVGYVILLPLSGKIVGRWGLEKSLTLSLPLFIGYFLTLAAVPQNHSLVWLAIGLITAHKIFYWPAFHATFSKYGDEGNAGTELSWMTMLRSGVGILGPLAGGLVAAAFGFPVLFMLAAVLVLMAAIPLLRTKEQYTRYTASYADPWRLMFDKRFANTGKAMLGFGENLIDLVYWPIFLFLVLGTTSGLGLLSAVTFGLMTVMSFIVGELSDKYSSRRVLHITLPFMMMGYVLRIFAVTPFAALAVGGVARMAYAGVHLPMLVLLYNNGRRLGVVRYTIAFEMVLAIIKAITAFVLVVVFMALPMQTAFIVTFLLAAVMAVMYALL